MVILALMEAGILPLIMPPLSWCVRGVPGSGTSKVMRAVQEGGHDEERREGGRGVITSSAVNEGDLWQQQLLLQMPKNCNKDRGKDPVRGGRLH